MKYTVKKDIAFELKHRVINIKEGQTVTDVDFPNENFINGFVKNGSIEVKKEKKEVKKIEKTT